MNWLRDKQTLRRKKRRLKFANDTALQVLHNRGVIDDLNDRQLEKALSANNLKSDIKTNTKWQRLKNRLSRIIRG